MKKKKKAVSKAKRTYRWQQKGNFTGVSLGNGTEKRKFGSERWEDRLREVSINLGKNRCSNPCQQCQKSLLHSSKWFYKCWFCIFLIFCPLCLHLTARRPKVKKNLVGFLCRVSTLWTYFVRLAACARVFSHAGTYVPSVWARYETFNRSCVWTAISPRLLSEEAVMPNKTLITSVTPFKTSQVEGTSLFTTQRRWSMNIQPGQKMCYCSSWLECKVQFKYSIFSSPFIEEVIKNSLFHNKTTRCGVWSTRVLQVLIDSAQPAAHSLNKLV